MSVTETQTVNGTLWGKTSQGWISMDYVSTSSSGGSNGGNGGATYTVTGSVVNVRAAAGMDSAVTSTVTKGTAVTIVAHCFRQR